MLDWNIMRKGARGGLVTESRNIILHFTKRYIAVIHGSHCNGFSQNHDSQGIKNS